MKVLELRTAVEGTKTTTRSELEGGVEVNRLGTERSRIEHGSRKMSILSISKAMVPRYR